MSINSLDYRKCTYSQYANIDIFNVTFFFFLLEITMVKYHSNMSLDCANSLKYTEDNNAQANFFIKNAS